MSEDTSRENSLVSVGSQDIEQKGKSNTNNAHAHQRSMHSTSDSQNHSTISNNDNVTLVRSSVHIPQEVLSLIIFFADKPTLASLMSVSRNTYDIAAPHLYTTITMTKSNADKLFAGFPRARRYRKIPVTDPLERSFTPGSSCPTLKLLWPNAILESDDEETPTMDETRPSHLDYAYPSPKSKQRKRQLFRFTSTLIIITRLCTDLCNEIRGWARYFAADFRPSRILFPCVKCLVITAQVVKLSADWIDRHQLDGHEELADPFQDMLSVLSEPDHYCITLPQYCEQDYLNYSSRRTMQDGHPPDKARRTDIRTRFHYRILGEVPSIAAALCHNTSPPQTRITLHNVTNGDFPLYRPDSTIFFAPYSPPNQSLLPKEQQVDKNSLRAQVRLLLRRYHIIRSDGSDTRAEFVFPDKERRDTDWKSLDQAVRNSLSRSRPVPNFIEYLGYEDVAPCRSCGTKEGMIHC